MNWPIHVPPGLPAARIPANPEAPGARAAGALAAVLRWLRGQQSRARPFTTPVRANKLAGICQCEPGEKSTEKLSDLVPENGEKGERRALLTAVFRRLEILQGRVPMSSQCRVSTLKQARCRKSQALRNLWTSEGIFELMVEVICVPQTEQESTFVLKNAIHPWKFRSAFKFFEVNSVDCGLFIRWIVEISFGDLKLRTLPTSSKSQCKSAEIQSEF